MQCCRADHGVELTAFQIIDPVMPPHVQLDPATVGIVRVKHPRQSQQHRIVIEPDDLGAGQARRQPVAQASGTAAKIQNNGSDQT